MSTLDYLLPTNIEARDIPDAWYQCIFRLLEDGDIHSYIIDQGSFERQVRREFDLAVILIKYPGTRPLIPEIRDGIGVPPPTSEKYIEEYLSYLMTDERKENETYTYGERLTNPKVIVKGVEYECEVNPVDEVIKIYRDGKYGTNQAAMEIAMPQDIIISDPPCLRLIDTRMLGGKLHFVVYFRSWDLWAGLPSNLAAIQLLKEDMCRAIGVESGSIIAVSKGLHLYDYSLKMALKLRNLPEEEIEKRFEKFIKEAHKG